MKRTAPIGARRASSCIRLQETIAQHTTEDSNRYIELCTIVGARDCSIEDRLYEDINTTFSPVAVRSNPSATHNCRRSRPVTGDVPKPEQQFMINSLSLYRKRQVAGLHAYARQSCLVFQLAFSVIASSTVAYIVSLLPSPDPVSSHQWNCLPDISQSHHHHQAASSGNISVTV